MSDPIIGLTLLKRGDAGTPEAFTTIANVGDISGLDLKNQMEDSTTHSSASTEESFPTIQSYGPVKFPVNFLPTDATHNYSAGLIKDWKNRTKRNFQMVFSDGTTWTFGAYVEQVTVKATVKGILQADVTLRVTGAATLA